MPAKCCTDCPADIFRLFLRIKKNPKLIRITTFPLFNPENPDFSYQAEFLDKKALLPENSFGYFEYIRDTEIIMNIKNILTEVEYTEERSVTELFDWFILKNEELKAWCRKHSRTKGLRKIKYGTPSRLFDRFTHELMPFAYYAKTYYSDVSSAKFKPCCGSEPYDGIIVDKNEKIFMEITNAIDGRIWALQKELLTENGCSPWEYNIHGVKGNKTKRKRLISDIKTSNECIPPSVPICKTKELVKKAASKKCGESMKPNLPYGQNKTILIVTFDDTVVRPSVKKKDWDDFIDFKQSEVDSMKHNFRKIILFGWLDKKFIT